MRLRTFARLLRHDDRIVVARLDRGDAGEVRLTANALDATGRLLTAGLPGPATRPALRALAPAAVAAAFAPWPLGPGRDWASLVPIAAGHALVTLSIRDGLGPTVALDVMTSDGEPLSWIVHAQPAKPPEMAWHEAEAIWRTLAADCRLVSHYCRLKDGCR